MVENVKHLGAELEGLMFPDVEGLEQRKVEVDVARPAENVSAEVAESPICGLGECGDVDLIIRHLIICGTHRDPRHQIGPRSGSADQV